MPQPTLNLLNVVPQQAGWDATVQANFQSILTHLTGRPLVVATYTVAAGGSQLPAAASYLRCVASVSDPAAGKAPLVISDGTHWLYMDGSTAL